MAEGQGQPESTSRRLLLKAGVGAIATLIFGNFFGKPAVSAPETTPEDAFYDEAVKLARKINFVETESPYEGHQTLAFDEEEKTSITNDTFIAIKTLKELGVEWPVIQQIVTGREVAKIAGDLSYGFNRIEIGRDPRTLVHEFAHVGFIVELDGKRWDGIMEASAQWFSDHAFETHDNSSDRPFGGCGEAGTYDYAAGASAFSKLIERFSQPGQPHLFGTMVNTYAEWENQDIENRKGKAMPADYLFRHVGETYRLPPDEVHKMFIEPIALRCTIDHSKLPLDNAGNML